MINFCFKFGATEKLAVLKDTATHKGIAVMGIILMSSSAIAEPDRVNYSDTSSPTENQIQQDLDKDKPAISVESKKTKELQIGDIVEVHPRTEMWETIHSGDLNRGTIQFKFIID